MFNPWKDLQGLFASPPRQVGVVSAYDDGIATVDFPGGGQIKAVGATTTVGQTVFVRGDVIEGEAPDAGTVEFIII